MSEEQRQRLFDGFWRSSDFNVQNAYICGCVKVLEISRRYTSKGSSSRRSNTRVYYMNDGRRDVRVCKTAFLRTHAVSNGRLTRALKASADNYGSPQGDRRGRHTPANKTSDADIAFVKEHIQSFPKYQSHYSRADNPIRQYLNPDLSITKMYILYKDVCSTEEKSPVSEGMYRKVFNEHFNLSFGRYYTYKLTIKIDLPLPSQFPHLPLCVCVRVCVCVCVSLSLFFLTPSALPHI